MIFYKYMSFYTNDKININIYAFFYQNSTCCDKMLHVFHKHLDMYSNHKLLSFM